jgi:poly(A) polymerase
MSITVNVEDLPKEVRVLFSVFGEEEDMIRLVGGAVRNLLIGKIVNDYDFATKYKPDKIIEILKKNKIKYFDINSKYGTITAYINGKEFEITTLRKDLNQKGRDTDVEFVDDYREDAARRDFTFNAISMDYTGKIYDYFSGQKDLRRSLIMFIGNPIERIKEDYLRILRFFRFACYYAYFLDFKSLNACKECVSFIKNVSINRISQEMYKIMNANYPVRILKIMEKHSILDNIFSTKEKLKFDNLEIFYSIKKFINFDVDCIFTIALIISANKDVKPNLIITKKEKKFLSLMEEYKLPSLSEFLIRERFFRIRDRKLVKTLVLMYICNNYDNFSAAKYYLEFVDNLENFNFDLRAKDLLEYGFIDRKEYSKLLNHGKRIFIESNFSATKNDIMRKLAKT